MYSVETILVVRTELNSWSRNGESRSAIPATIVVAEHTSRHPNEIPPGFAGQPEFAFGFAAIRECQKFDVIS